MAELITRHGGERQPYYGQSNDRRYGCRSSAGRFQERILCGRILRGFSSVLRDGMAAGPSTRSGRAPALPWEVGGLF
jgi:hypothetical protein